MEVPTFCACGKLWSRQCQWDQLTKPKYLDTTKLTNDPMTNQQIAADPKNYVEIEHYAIMPKLYNGLK